MTVVAFVLLGSIFVGISIYAALNPASLTHATEAQAVVLIPLYAFAILGFPTSALLVWRAVEAAPNDAGSSSSQPRRSTFSTSKSASRDLENEVNKYSIELAGRRSRSQQQQQSRRDLDVRYDPGVVSVNVEVEIKEEGEFDEDEKVALPSFANDLDR